MSMPQPIKPEGGNRYDGFISFMITAMFATMVFTITRTNPFDLAVKTMKHKADISARLNICNIAAAQQDQYKNFMAESYKTGCITTARDYLYAITEESNPVRFKQLKIEFQAQEGSEWERVLDLCSKYTAEWELKGTMKERVVYNLMTAFNCEETLKQAEALGLTGTEDVQ